MIASIAAKATVSSGGIHPSMMEERGRHGPDLDQPGRGQVRAAHSDSLHAMPDWSAPGMRRRSRSRSALVQNTACRCRPDPGTSEVIDCSSLASSPPLARGLHLGQHLVKAMQDRACGLGSVQQRAQVGQSPTPCAVKVADSTASDSIYWRRNMNEQQLKELLLQSLEQEIGGVQVYEAALKCAQNDDLREEWEKYLAQTQGHELVLRTTLQEIGIDPEEETPGRIILRSM